MNFSEIVNLSVQQRIVLADAIWDSITADRKKSPLTEDEIEEARQRIIAAQKKPAYMGQWERVHDKSPIHVPFSFGEGRDEVIKGTFVMHPREKMQKLKSKK